MPNSKEGSSPKKFFKALSVSPFRHSTRADPQTHQNPLLGPQPVYDLWQHPPNSSFINNSYNPSMSSFNSTTSNVHQLQRTLGSSTPQPGSHHGRSHSHDILHSHSRSDLALKSWASLIPPVPNQPRNDSSKELKVQLNRHTIAVLPTGPKNVPDFLQPLTNPDAERSYVISRGDSESPMFEVSSELLLYLNHFPPLDQVQIPGLFDFAPREHPSRPSTSTPPKRYSEKGHTRQSSSQSKLFPPTHPPGLEHQRLQEAVLIKLNNPFLPPQNLSERQTQSHDNQRHQKYQQNQQQQQQHQWSLQHAPIQQRQQFLLQQQMAQQQRKVQMRQPQNPQFDDRSQSQPHSQPPQYQLPSHPSPKQVQKQQPQSKRATSEKKRKVCKKCNQVINGQFVRALGSAYHIDCFTCYQCGKQCSAKFFPQEVKTENGEVIQVPLCEYDYFRKLDLICFECHNALRGPYINALGNKYHLEHFKCSTCGKVFDSDESYYEHDNNIYCHLHYSKLFATKCEGCQSSIVKQFVELLKGGRNQQWHPECYMVFKFWNVYITADCVGLQQRLGMDIILANLNDIDPNDLLIVEHQLETVVMNCWLVLSGFEEISATCISEMLLCACTGKRGQGLFSTGKLVLYVEVLFDALDFVQKMCLEHKPDPNQENAQKNSLSEEVYSVDAFDKFQTLRKEPRNISGKLMSYLAILRKSNQLSDSGSLSSELLSVVTGCAHYLKLLIRIGLNNALKLNKIRGDTKALDGFLMRTKKFDDIESADKLPGDSRISIGSRLAIPLNASDACRACLKSIEKSCVRYKNLRWHMKCFECSICHRQPSPEFVVESFVYGTDEVVLCNECAATRSSSNFGYSSGFVTVSDLSQLSYLLKIAIFRSRSAIKKDSDLGKSDSALKTSMTNIEEEPSESETEYSRTLNDVTELRKKRESQKLSNSIKKNARKSVIIEAPEAVAARKDNTIDENEDTTQRKSSNASSLSFVALRNDSDQFDFQSGFKIRDDPPQRFASHSLDRTSDLLKNEKSLTLDDIPRIVAAEQAREQRPNAFKHHNSLYQKKAQRQLRTVSAAGSVLRRDSLRNFVEAPAPGQSCGSKYYSELSKKEHFILRHIAVEAFLNMGDSHTREELINLIQTRKLPTFWDKFKFGGSEKNKHINVFGVELSEVTKKYGVDSDLGVGPAQLRIPIVVDDVINALRQKDMSVEGIFRLNGNIKNLRELTEQINKTPLKSPAFSNYSAVQLAALMKKWLREMPNPLLSFGLYDVWISSRREKVPAKCNRILELAYCMLPRSHRNLLEVLLYFFSWVASFAEIDEETGSKMDTHNLATVIAPNILLSKEQAETGGNQLSESHFIAIEVVNQLIEIHEELAVIPPDLWEFYEKCEFQNSKDEISTKDIFSRISKVAKENPNFFDNYLTMEDSTDATQPSTITRGQTKVEHAPDPHP